MRRHQESNGMLSLSRRMWRHRMGTAVDIASWLPTAIGAAALLDLVYGALVR